MPIAMEYGSGSYTPQKSSGGGGTVNTGLTMTLLWTNPSPSSSFAAQTVSLDLSSYDAVAVVPIFSTSSGSTTQMQIFLCDDTKNNLLLITARANNNNGGRNLTINASGLTFGAATYNGNTNNGYVIPYKIFGIKGIT